MIGGVNIFFALYTFSVVAQRKKSGGAKQFRHIGVVVNGIEVVVTFVEDSQGVVVTRRFLRSRQDGSPTPRSPSLCEARSLLCSTRLRSGANDSKLLLAVSS